MAAALWVPPIQIPDWDLESLDDSVMSIDSIASISSDDDRDDLDDLSADEAMDGGSASEADSDSDDSDAEPEPMPDPRSPVQVGVPFRNAQGHDLFRLMEVQTLPVDASLGPLSGARMGFLEGRDGPLVVVSTAGRVLAQMAAPNALDICFACRPAGSAPGNPARVVFAVAFQGSANKDDAGRVYELLPDGRILPIPCDFEETPSFVQSLHALSDGTILIHRAPYISKVTPEGTFASICSISGDDPMVTLAEGDAWYDGFPLNEALTTEELLSDTLFDRLEVQPDGMSFRVFQSDPYGEAVYHFPAAGAPTVLAPQAPPPAAS